MGSASHGPLPSQRMGLRMSSHGGRELTRGLEPYRTATDDMRSIAECRSYRPMCINGHNTKYND